MSRLLYDWRESILPSKAVIVNVGAVQDGYVSRSSYQNDVGIPGGRVRVDMTFDTQRIASGPDYSWTVSKLKGNIFRLPYGIWQTPQVAQDGDLGLARGYLSRGVPFSSGALFSGGSGFRFTPTLETAGTALEGNNTIAIDETRWPGYLAYGKWIGLGRGAYHVEDIDRDGVIATVTVGPTFRRDIAAGEFVSLRPSVVCQARDISSFVAMFDNVDMVQPGQLSMYEVIDQDYL